MQSHHWALAGFSGRCAGFYRESWQPASSVYRVRSATRARPVASLDRKTAFAWMYSLPKCLETRKVSITPTPNLILPKYTAIAGEEVLFVMCMCVHSAIYTYYYVPRPTALWRPLPSPYITGTFLIPWRYPSGYGTMAKQVLTKQKTYLPTHTSAFSRMPSCLLHSWR